VSLQIVTSISAMQQLADQLRLEGKRIALVPTMGYLHAGHASLIVRARSLADVVVVSVFVNPTQFAPNEDFARYPRDLEHDKKIAEDAGADIIFHPTVEEMYPVGFSTTIDPGDVALRFEGKFRPTHFRGVTTVVAKLFNITKPHIALFGQKDVQQAFIIQKMVRELNFDIQIVIAPVVRENDGLAMSSRNTYLSKDERARATALYKSLEHARKRILEGEKNLNAIQQEMRKIIEASNPTQIDYIAFIHPDTFEELQSLEMPDIIIALAVRYGATRLIDTFYIHQPSLL